MGTAAMAGLEAAMWSLESDPRTRAGVAAILVLDGPPDMERLRSRVAEVVATNARLRSTVTARPRPLAPCRWVEHPHANLDERLAVVSVLDAPGGLPEIAAELMEAPYKADEFLWDTRVVVDLPDGAAALVVRLNHCITDGLGAMIMASQFFDLDAAGTRLNQPPAQPAPSVEPLRAADRLTTLAESVVDDAKSTLRLARRLLGTPLPAVATTVSRPAPAVRRGAEFTASSMRLLSPSPKQLSPSLDRHSGRIRIHTLELSLPDVKKAAESLDASVNDIFMTGLSRGLHAYHVGVGQDLSELRANMAVSSRATSETTAGGNYFVPVRIRLPLTSGELATSVQRVQVAAARAKTEAALGIAPYVSELLGRLPARMAARAMGSMYHGVDVGASNFPGPPIRLWVAGSRMRDFYAVGPRSGGAVGVTMITYAGTAYISLNMDAGAVEDPHLLESCLRAAYGELLAFGQGGVHAGRMAESTV